MLATVGWIATDLGGLGDKESNYQGWADGTRPSTGGKHEQPTGKGETAFVLTRPLQWNSQQSDLVVLVQISMLIH